MSKERPTLHLKKNPDFPPKPPTITEEFDANDQMRRANHILDDIKRDIYAAGSNPAKISKEWSKARNLHDSINKSIQEYKGTKDLEERSALAQSIKEQIATLAGDVEEDIREAYQTEGKDTFKSKYSLSPEVEAEDHKKRVREGAVLTRLPKGINFDTTFPAYTKTEGEMYILRTSLEEGIKQRQERLGELEGQEKNSAGHFYTNPMKQDREAEFLKTEKELLDLEKKLRDLDGPPQEKTQTGEPKDLTHKEQVEKLEGLVQSYDGEAHYGVPARIESESAGEEQAPEHPSTEYAEFEPVAPLTQIPDLSKMDRIDAKAESNAHFTEVQAGLSNEETHRKEFYFQLLRKEQRARGDGGVLAERLGLVKGDIEKGGSRALREAREGWIQSRAALAKHRLSTLEERRALRGGQVIEGLNAYKGKETLDQDKVRERYQRRFIVKDVVFGAEQEEQAERHNAMESRDRTVVDKLYNAYKALPPKLRIFMSGAGVAMGLAAIATGAALPILGIPLAGMAIGARLRWEAETAREQGDMRTHAELTKKAGFTSIAGVANMNGNWLTRFFNKKSVAEADARLANASELGDLGDADTLTNLSRAHQDAFARKRQVDNLAGTVGLGASLAGGAATGALAGALSPHELAHAHMAPHHPSPADEHAVMTARHYESGPGHEGGATEHTPVHHSPQGHRTHLDHSPRADSGHHTEATPVPVHFTDEDRNLIQDWEIKNGGLPPHSDEHIPEVLARLHENNGPDAFKDVHFEAAHAPEPVATPEPVAPIPEAQPEIHHEPAPSEAEAASEPETPAVSPEAHSVEVPAEHTPAPAEQPVHAPVAEPTPQIPEAPAHAESPVSPQSEAAPSHETPAEVPAVFTNGHGVRVDLHKPDFYPWKVPHTKDILPVIDGGTEALRKEWAQQYLIKHPEVSYVLVPAKNIVTGKIQLEMYGRGPDGFPVTPVDAVIDPVTGATLPIPDPKDYVRVREPRV